MTRLLVALALAVSGCATGDVYYSSSPCYRRPTTADTVFLIGDLVLSGLAAGAQLTETMRQAPPPPADSPGRPMRRVFGTVSWKSGERVGGVTVSLRAHSGFVLLDTVADDRGRFWFPLPLPADWYRITVDDDQGAGESKIWLRDKPPAYLDVVLEPKEVPPSD